MAVYVDDMYRSPIGQFGRMKMSHMIADTPGELRHMARRIGLKLEWIQNKGEALEHFDVSMTVRARAIKQGAIELTMLQLGRIIHDRIMAMAKDKYATQYEQGKRDRAEKFAREAQPYKAGSPEATAWLIGWKDQDKEMKAAGDNSEPKRTVRA